MHLLLLRHHPSQKPSLSLQHLLMFLGFYLLIEIGTGIRSHMFSTGKVSPGTTHDLLGAQRISTGARGSPGHSELPIEGTRPWPVSFCLSLKIN